MTIAPLQLYKCLADETRLLCMLLIQQEGELCVCELTTALADSQPKISRHLGQLRECSLLQDRREGQWIYYQVNPALPDWVSQLMALTLANNQDLIKPAIRRLAAMADRPVRNQQCCA